MSDDRVGRLWGKIALAGYTVTLRTSDNPGFEWLWTASKNDETFAVTASGQDFFGTLCKLAQKCGVTVED